MRRPRLALPAATAAVLLVLAGCGDDAADTASDPAPTEPTSESPSASASESPSGKSSTKPKPSAPPAGLVVDVTVQGDQVSPQAEVVEAEVGEPITLDIRSDRTGEMHVHSSPEQYVEFGPGRSTEQIVVERPGSVEVEEHDSGALVLRLLVQ